MLKIRYNLIKLKASLELTTGRQYTWATIADSAGISRNTMSAWVNNKTARADLDGLAKIMSFFAAEGMPITVADLFEVTSEPGFAVVAPNPSYGGLALLRDQGDQSSANPTRTPPTASAPRLIHQLG